MSLVSLAIERFRIKTEIAELEKESKTHLGARNDAQEQFDNILATIKTDARKGPTQVEGQELIRLQEEIHHHDEKYEAIRKDIRDKRKRRNAIPDEQTRIMAKELPDNTLFKDIIAAMDGKDDDEEDEDESEEEDDESEAD